MDYGYFDNSTNEYVITTPKTPVKWINYIGQLSFGGFVDNTGGGVICKSDPALNRIVKYFAQLPASDFKGETLYIRFKNNNGTYKIFSPFFVPTLDSYKIFECHIGLGYSTFISEFYDIRAEITVFVPINDIRVVRDIKITNLKKKSIDIDIIPVVEYTHFEALKQLTNADWVPQTMQSKVFEEGNGFKILTQYAFMKRDIEINYFTSNLPFSSFESDRKNFLGDNEYGTWSNPLSLQKIELSNYEAKRGDNIGALMHHLGLFQPGETKRVITQLGQEESINKAIPWIKKYRSEKEVEKSFRELHSFWESYLSKIQFDTPELKYEHYA